MQFDGGNSRNKRIIGKCILIFFDLTLSSEESQVYNTNLNFQ